MDRPGLYEVVVLGRRFSTSKQLFCYFVVSPSRQEAIRVVRREFADDGDKEWLEKAKFAAFYHNDGMVRVRRGGSAVAEFRAFESRCEAQQREEVEKGIAYA